jgi:hypothetical protein
MALGAISIKRKMSRKHVGWFNERLQFLMEAIAVRNQAQLVFNCKCKPGALESLSLILSMMSYSVREND